MLVELKQGLLLEDEVLKKMFSVEVNETFKYLEEVKNKRQNFSHLFFDHVSIAQALSILSKIENDVRSTEYSLVSFCYEQAEPRTENYTFYKALIVQSANYVKKGEPITLYAGIGAFSTTCSPSININGKNIAVNENAVAVYNFKAASIPGKHIIPVSIKFTKNDGSNEIMEENIEYIVLKDQ